MGVPATLLRKMYLSSSLRNTSDGFQFSLKNRLAPATIVGIGTLETAQKTFPPEVITVELNKACRPAAQVDPRRPLFFDVNDVLTVHVAGRPLAPGHHPLTLHLHVREVGHLCIPIEDDVRTDALHELRPSTATLPVAFPS